MQNLKSVFNLFLASFIFVDFFSACHKAAFCEGNGMIVVSNNSEGNDQQVFFDGLLYTTLSPGESQNLRVTVGSHYVRFVDLDDKGVPIIQECGMGLNDFLEVMISECETIRRNSHN